MMCDLAIRRVATTGGAHPTYLLRIATKRVLGSAGASATRDMNFTGKNEVLTFLRQELTIGAEGVDLAAQAMESSKLIASRFIVFAEDLDIPFATLELADALPFD